MMTTSVARALSGKDTVKSAVPSLLPENRDDVLMVESLSVADQPTGGEDVVNLNTSGPFPLFTTVTCTSTDSPGLTGAEPLLTMTLYPHKIGQL